MASQMPSETRISEDVLAENPNLRDRLAIDRTELANERTLLAYVRTALTLFLVGMSFVHVPMFHPDPEFGGLTYGVTGWLFAAVGGATAAIGYRRYRQFRSRAPKEASSPPRTD